MSIPKMTKAMGYIDDNLVSGAVEYKRTKKKNGWLKWGAVAACLCLVVGIQSMFSQSAVSPFVLTAYAVEDDGTFTPYIMQQNVSVPLGKVEIETGLDGFLFSCPLENESDLSTVTLLSAQSSPNLPAKELYTTIEENGLHYFYYIPAEDEDTPITFNVNINKENGDYHIYEIVINSEENGFTATLVNQLIK